MPSHPAQAAGLPSFCSATVDGQAVAANGPEQLNSGATLVMDCMVQQDSGTPYWLVFRTDGDPATWTLHELDGSGAVVEETVVSAPDAIIPAGAYRVHMETRAPSVVELLTRPSGLREEVARAQTKTMLSIELRASQSGTNILQPDLKDLSQRIATVADVKSNVVHPSYSAIEAELANATEAVAAFKESYGSEGAAVTSLDRDLAQARQAFADGQLDRVGELAGLIQRFASEQSETAAEIGKLDANRMVALRLAVIVGGIALIALTVAGGAVYFWVKRNSLMNTEESYENS
jgi:hypothetical protein